jgi:hypothetical protein
MNKKKTVLIFLHMCVYAWHVSWPGTRTRAPRPVVVDEAVHKSDFAREDFARDIAGTATFKEM